MCKSSKLELMQFEQQPIERFVFLWKSHRPKIALILAPVMYSKVTDCSPYPVSGCGLESLSLSTLGIPTAVDRRLVCTEHTSRGCGPGERRCRVALVKNLYTLCSQLLDRYTYWYCLLLCAGMLKHVFKFVTIRCLIKSFFPQGPMTCGSVVSVAVVAVAAAE